MKRIINSILAIIMTLTMVACSSTDYTKEVAAVIDNYFSCVEEGDYNAALENCTSDVDDGLGLKDLDQMIEQELSSAGLGDDFDAAAKDWLKYTLQNTFDDHEIEEITFDSDNEAQVIVTGTALDFDQFNSDEFQDDLTTMTENYVNEHMDDMTDLYLTLGEDAAMEQIIKDISTFVFDQMKDFVDNIEKKEYATRFTLEKTEDNWKINKIEHTMRDDQNV